MNNFSFIPPQWANIAQTPQEAEQHVYGAPLYAAMLCRKSLEEWVRWMYEHDSDLTLPYDTSLSSLIHEQGFKNVVAPMQFNHINLIRKLGNTAVHSNAKLKPQEALYALQLLHGFIGWVTIIYSEERPLFKPFDEAIIPKEGSKDKIGRAHV
jgi:type I restriction enzyme R subunit